MKVIKYFIIAYLFTCSIYSVATEEDAISNYLDIYLTSMMSDVRNYVLALEFSNGSNEEQDDLLRAALEMKYYDLSNLLPKTNNMKVITIICKAESTLRDNAVGVSANCSGELCKEIKKLENNCLEAMNKIQQPGRGGTHSVPTRIK